MTITDERAVELIERNKLDQPTSRLWSPAVILISGDDAGLNDQVENPFVVHFEFGSAAAYPIMDVIQTGDEFQVRATEQTQSETIDLSVMWRKTELSSVGEDTVPGESGFADQTVQVPRTRISQAQVNQSVRLNEWLWIDPHHTFEPIDEVRRESRFSWASMKRKTVQNEPDRLIILVKPRTTGSN